MGLQIELGSRMDGSEVLHRYFLEVLWSARSAIYIHTWTLPEGTGASGAEFLPLHQSEGCPFADEARTTARNCLATTSVGRLL